MEPTTPAPPMTLAPADRPYLLERVGEAAVVQVYADGFRDLSLREKTPSPAATSSTTNGTRTTSRCATCSKAS
jgi:hypothetical protein